MKYALVTAALAAPIVLAAPTKRQGSNIDTTVLQFALTLEHLENVFYKGALQKFSQEDFRKAGYGANYYYNLKHIAYDEQSHVEFLQTALTAAGQTPVAPCTYSFPYTDVNSFITLSSVIEGVGTSAYLGGAPLITSKDYLTAAGSILVTEALHTSYQRAAVNEVPFPSPYGTPLDPTSVYSIASAFIKSCPDSNAKLPFTPYPALTLKTTAGTCELPDCDPKTFYKRGWEASPAPTACPYGDKPGYKPGDKDGHMPDWKPDGKDGYKPDGKDGYKPDGKDGYKPDGKDGYKPDGKDGYMPDGKDGYKPDGKDGYKPDGKDGYKPDGKDVDYKPDNKVDNNSDWAAYGKDGKDTPASASKNLPALKIGQKVSFTAASAVPAGSFITFVSGLGVVSVPAEISGNDVSTSIPDSVMGQAYVFVTKTAAANNKLDGSSVLFGPAIVEVTPAAPTINFSQA